MVSGRRVVGSLLPRSFSVVRKAGPSSSVAMENQISGSRGTSGMCKVFLVLFVSECSRASPSAGDAGSLPTLSCTSDLEKVLWCLQCEALGIV